MWQSWGFGDLGLCCLRMGSTEERVVAVIMVGGPTKGTSLFHNFWISNGIIASHFSLSWKFVYSWIVSFGCWIELWDPLLILVEFLLKISLVPMERVNFLFELWKPISYSVMFIMGNSILYYYSRIFLIFFIISQN